MTEMKFTEFPSVKCSRPKSIKGLVISLYKMSMDIKYSANRTPLEFIFFPYKKTAKQKLGKIII